MKRVVTGLILIPLFIYVVLWSPSLLFLAVVAAVAMLSFREYARLMSHYNVRAPGVFGYAAGLLILFLPRLDFVADQIFREGVRLFSRANGFSMVVQHESVQIGPSLGIDIDILIREQIHRSRIAGGQ